MAKVHMQKVEVQVEVQVQVQVHVQLLLPDVHP